MKRLIRNFLVTLMMIGAAVSCLRAQDKPAESSQPAPKKQDRDTPMEKVFAALKLAPDQREKVKAIFEGRHQRLQDLIKDSSLSQEEKKKKFREIVETGDAKLKTILTPEQQEKWKQIKEENAKRLHGDSASKGKQ
jgi:Spy/CpxP family protein refolding chaperone